jgi:hypothetical protein
VELDLFEFVTVMVSIILGLSLARLLDGIAGVALRADRVTLFPVHSAWVVVVLITHATVWWSTWDYRSIEWDFARFVTVNSTPLVLFFISAILLPRDSQGGGLDLKAHFGKVRTMLMAGYAFAMFVWILDGPLIFRSEPLYNPMRMGQLLGLFVALWGLRNDGERVQAVIAAVVLLITLGSAWVRFFPGAFGPVG